MHDPAWRAEADARARKHRFRSTVVTVVGPDGRPVAGVPVSAQLTGPDFRLGTCIASDLLFDAGARGEAYRKTVLAHFDAAVCENDMKWYATERTDGGIDHGPADRTLDWCQRHGLAVRGHCLQWDKAKFVLPWVQALPDAELRRRALARTAESAARYRGRLTAWDVNNEMLDGGFWRGRLGPDIDAAFFQAAHVADPETPLFVNEYGILDNDTRTGLYLDLIARLRQAGAPVGGIGIQEHAAERFVGTPEAAEADRDRPERQGRGPLLVGEVWSRLDRSTSRRSA
jgi:endo-1,4-beta-xylanase